jgi:hypothetical protein
MGVPRILKSRARSGPESLFAQSNKCPDVPASPGLRIITKPLINLHAVRAGIASVCAIHNAPVTYARGRKNRDHAERD